MTEKNKELISINEAAANGARLLRKPIWALPNDYLKIDIFNGKPGPWVHIYSDLNMEWNGRNPVDTMLLGFDPDKKEWVPYIEECDQP